MKELNSHILPRRWQNYAKTGVDMGAFPLIQYEAVVQQAFRLFDDGVRRWRDLDIAEWLGMAQPLNIRQTIEENRAELERHGSLHVVRENPGEQGGRPGTAYYLNIKQAVRYCTMSRTARADDVCFVLVEVWDKVRNGELSTAPRMELRALEVAADRIVAPILAEQREFHSAVIVRMDKVERKVDEVEKQVRGKRKKFSKAVEERYIGTVAEHCNGKCPCCRKVLIVQDGKRLAGSELDHWYMPSKCGARDGWLICERCNLLLREPEFKQTKYPEFAAFQSALRVYDDQHRQQGSFGFF